MPDDGEISKAQALARARRGMPVCRRRHQGRNLTPPDDGRGRILRAHGRAGRPARERSEEPQVSARLGGRRRVAGPGHGTGNPYRELWDRCDEVASCCSPPIRRRRSATTAPPEHDSGRFDAGRQGAPGSPRRRATVAQACPELRPGGPAQSLPGHRREPKHPNAPLVPSRCGWWTSIIFRATRRSERWFYECKVCDAKLVVSSDGSELGG